MIQPTLHPEPVTAPCARRGRFAFGLTVRTLVLLGTGFLWLIPGYFQSRFAYGLLVWDALILLAALVDGVRLPRPASISLGRTWLSAPALGTSVEIKLSVKHRNLMRLDCMLIDDLPAQLVLTPALHRLEAWPGPPATVRYTVKPLHRGDVVSGALFLQYRSTLGLVSRWASAPLMQARQPVVRRRQPSSKHTSR